MTSWRQVGTARSQIAWSPRFSVHLFRVLPEVVQQQAHLVGVTDCQAVIGGPRDDQHPHHTARPCRFSARSLGEEGNLYRVRGRGQGGLTGVCSVRRLRGKGQGEQGQGEQGVRLRMWDCTPPLRSSPKSPSDPAPLGAPSCSGNPTCNSHESMRTKAQYTGVLHPLPPRGMSCL